MGTTRRAFVAQTAAAASIASVPLGAQGKEAGWYDRPMRWAQVAFVEDDPGNFSPQFWFDYFRSSHCDAVCLSAGGGIAFYPTKIPLHYRSKFLGNSDPFGEMVAGCRKLGMNVIARTDPHAVHQDVFDAHPDWIAVDAAGKKRRHWAMPELWVTCALGPYNFDFMTEVTSEIISGYDVDGIFSNRWTGSGMCYCEHCARNFRNFSGLELPTGKADGDVRWRRYAVWHEQRLFELWDKWDAAIKAIKPHASFIANSGGGAFSELNMKTIGERAPTLFADRQARHGLMPPWANGRNGKEYRSTMGGKPVGGIFSVGFEEENRWKDSVQSSDEIRLWVADGIAQGLRPWFTKFNARPIDRRWMPVVADIYNWHFQNEKYLRNQRSLARVGMVYSQQTARYYGGDQARQKVEDAATGFYQALVESRIPFEMVNDGLLDTEHLAPYRTLVLPNIAALSLAQCQQLRRFVQNGGGLVASYETSLYDELGVKRADFGLADLFGCQFENVEGPMRNSYLNLEKQGARFHPLLRGFEDAPRIINGVNQVRVKTRKAGSASTWAPLTLVPAYPDLPMEEVYARVPRTDIPGVYAREFGKGRVVYFPADLDRTFWEVLAVEHLRLLGNAVTWATNQQSPVEVTGKGVLDLSIWAQKDSLAIHLVNLTNPMMMKGPLREINPVGMQKARIEIPSGRQVTDVKLLVARTSPVTSRSGNVLLVEVPSIDVHEVIAVDLR